MKEDTPPIIPIPLESPTKPPKIETSKLLCFITGAWFVICTIAAFTVWVVLAFRSPDGCSWMDCAVLVAMITTSGSIFAICLTGYYNMNRFVNVVKVKMHAYRERLNLLIHYKIVDPNKELQKLDEAADEIDEKAASEEENTTAETQNTLTII